MANAHSADLVLVGGGHAHVQVLRRWMMAPMAGVRLTLVVDVPGAVYSGMVPGFVAGDYDARELEIDVVPLARRAGARVVLARATGVDPLARTIEVEGRPPVAYDVASLDVGSSVRGLDVPGAREHALATRPIAELVARAQERLPRGIGDGRGEPLRVLVIGGGAAGVELACALQARLRADGREAALRVLCASGDVLPGYPARVARRARAELERRGIRVRADARVTRVEKGAVQLGGQRGQRVECDLVVWATGAAPQAFLAEAPLPLDADGFVRVRPTLQVEGHDDLFAVGDCASLVETPWLRKAGVYAVREGPFVDANLRAQLRGRPLRDYRPQRDFLMLLNLGEGEAMGAKWGVPFAGRWVWRWKDWIDRRFMRRFQVLGADDAPAPDFPSRESMGMQDMPCGGCAAKVGASPLERALGRLPPAPADAAVRVGLERPDDAAAFAAPGGGDEAVLVTVDAFRAFTDDPWLVGRVAAVNAASDVYAVGGRPRHALALVTVPEEDPSRAEESLFQVLAGARAALDPLGISLVGGHSTSGEDLFVGLTVTGELEGGAALLGLDGLRRGDHLILTKPLGTGVLLAADMKGEARGEWVRAAHASMLRANREAAAVARTCGALACTDVSGFGLAGHLTGLLRASGVSAQLWLDSIPVLDGARALLARGVRSSFHEQNARGRRGLALAPGLAGESVVDLLFDPQTSGGLLFGVSAERGETALAALRRAGDTRAAVIGEVTDPRGDGTLFAVSAAPVGDAA